MSVRTFGNFPVNYLSGYEFVKSVVGIRVEHLSQVIAHGPVGATQQQLCWLVESCYIDAANDRTGRTFSTCRFGDIDLPTFKLRSRVLDELIAEAEQEEPWLDLSSYSGPRPFNNETDYCTEIIRYVIQPMYDENGCHVSEASMYSLT